MHKIAIIGFGTVGSGVYESIVKNNDLIWTFCNKCFF